MEFHCSFKKSNFFTYNGLLVLFLLKHLQKTYKKHGTSDINNKYDALSTYKTGISQNLLRLWEKYKMQFKNY